MAIEQTKAAAKARDFDEYKRLRRAQVEAVVRDPKNAAPQPAGKSADSSAEGDNSASGAEKLSASDQQSAESGSASEADAKTQKQEQPKKDRLLDGRTSELTKKLKTAEDGRERLERELEELRKGDRSPEAPPTDRSLTVRRGFCAGGTIPKAERGDLPAHRHFSPQAPGRA